MNTLTPFQYGDQQVRTIESDGEPLFHHADVCRILEHTNPSVAARMLDEGDSLLIDVRTISAGQTALNFAHPAKGNASARFVTEPGLYTLIFASKAKGAKDFRRWVTREVLPAIRKHGGYLTPAAVEEALADPDTIIRLATSLKEERAARAALEAQRTADAPKVLFADAVSTSDTTILVGDLAKILRGNGVDIGGTRLFQVLRDRGYLIARKGSDWNSPTQKAMDLGLFRIKETAVTHSDGHVTVNKTPKVTGKGQRYFVERFLSGRLEPAA